jgi:monoamine oxidase
MERQEEIGGDHAFRLRNGYSALVSRLQEECTRNHAAFRMEHVVERVEYRSDRAFISGHRSTEKFELAADAVVVTVPVSLLRPGNEASIVFDPALPSSKLDAIRGTEVGSVMRVALVFQQPFWKQIKGSDGRSLAKMRFLFSHDRYFPTWWTTQPVESPVLVAWSSGPRAEQFRAWNRDRIVEQALSSLATILPVAKSEMKSMLKGAFLHDWQADPFSRGAYTYLCVGAANAPSELARPIGKVFFAGEATDVNGDHATVHGAIASGQRVAREILSL